MSLKVLSRSQPIQITIDNEPVTVDVKVMTREAGIAWLKKFLALGDRKGDIESMAKEMDPVERKKMADTRERESTEFITSSVRDYCTLKDGQIENEDGPVRTGDQILAAFPTRFDVLAAFYQAIYAGNFMGAEEKNALRSRSIFLPGSKLQTPNPTGAGPEATAGVVEKLGSVDRVDATDESLPTVADERLPVGVD